MTDAPLKFCPFCVEPAACVDGDGMPTAACTNCYGKAHAAMWNNRPIEAELFKENERLKIELRAVRKHLREAKRGAEISSLTAQESAKAWWVLHGENQALRMSRSRWRSFALYLGSDDHALAKRRYVQKQMADFEREETK